MRDAKLIRLRLNGERHSSLQSFKPANWAYEAFRSGLVPDARLKRRRIGFSILRRDLAERNGAGRAAAPLRQRDGGR